MNDMKTRTTNILFQRRKSHLTEIINQKAKKGYIPKSISPLGFILYEKKAPDDSIYVVESTSAPHDLKLQDPEQYDKIVVTPKLTVFRSKRPIQQTVYSEMCSFEGWQYEEEAQWLSTKAAEGLMLDSRDHDEYNFVKCKPGRYEFCYDFSKIVNASEYLKVFSCDNWKYICSYQNTHYFFRPLGDTAKADIQPQLIEIRKSKKTGFWFGIQSIFSTVIGSCGIVLPNVYSMELGWRIALGIIGAIIAISGISTFCMIAAENSRLNKRRKLLLYKINNKKGD